MLQPFILLIHAMLTVFVMMIIKIITTITVTTITINQQYLMHCIMEFMAMAKIHVYSKRTWWRRWYKWEMLHKRIKHVNAAKVCRRKSRQQQQKTNYISMTRDEISAAKKKFYSMKWQWKLQLFGMYAEWVTAELQNCWFLLVWYGQT